MLNFESVKTISSATFEGVSYRVRVLNTIERAKRNAPIISQRHRAEQLATQLQPDVEGEERYVPAVSDPVERRRVQLELNSLMESVVMPAHIRAGFVGVEGATFDDAPYTAESFLSGAPDEMLAEFHAACLLCSGMGPDQLKNLPSVGTSDGATAAPATDSIASSA